MTALAKDTDIKNKNVTFYTSYLVAASQTIYKGALVSILPASGLLVVGANTATHICVGVADESVVSTTAGVKTCRVASGGMFLLTTGTLDQITAFSTTLFVLDSGTVDLVANATQSIKAGRCVFWVDGTHSWVYIPPFGAALM